MTDNLKLFIELNIAQIDIRTGRFGLWTFVSWFEKKGYIY